jgi:hypothetical protein
MGPCCFLKVGGRLGVVAHVCNLSTGEAETVRSQVRDHSGLHNPEKKKVGGALGLEHLGPQMWPLRRGYLHLWEGAGNVCDITNSFSVSGPRFVLGPSVTVVFCRGICVEGSLMDSGVNLREMEEFHQLRGCCIPSWFRQCLPDQGTAGPRAEPGQKGLKST